MTTKQEKKENIKNNMNKNNRNDNKINSNKNNNENKYYSDFTRQNYSSKEFLRLIEKRFRKELRIEENIKLKDEKGNKKKYLILDDGRLSTLILNKLLRNTFGEHIELELIEKKDKNSNKENNNKDNKKNNLDNKTNIISSDCLEEYITKRLKVFFENKNLTTLTEKTINPLKIITADEIKQLGTILKLNGELPKKEHEFITKLQEQYPQTKTSLVKSFDFINKLIQ